MTLRMATASGMFGLRLAMCGGVNSMAGKCYLPAAFCDLRTRYAAPMPTRTTIRVERIQRCLIRSAFDWSASAAGGDGEADMVGTGGLVCDRPVVETQVRARSINARQNNFAIRFMQFVGMALTVTLNDSGVKFNRSHDIECNSSWGAFSGRTRFAANCPVGRAGRREPVTTCQSDISDPDLRDVLGRSKLSWSRTQTKQSARGRRRKDENETDNGFITDPVWGDGIRERLSGGALR